MDRSKFKATSVSAMKKQEKEVSKMTNRRNSDRTDYLGFDEGSNKIRLFPAHPDSSSFVYPYGRWWLLREVSYEKNGENITEIKKRPVYNAKIHGSAQHDIVEEYIKFTTKVLSDEITDEEELKEKLENLTHWRNGLRCKQEWVSYIHKYVNGNKQFGLLTFSNGVKNKLNEIAITEDDVSNPIATDPFTDPDEGKAIIVTYAPKEKQAKDVYKAAIEFRGNYALTDKELEDFSKLDSLEKLFNNVYKRRDFDLAVEGLQLFDQENKFGIFEHDEWLDIVEKLQSEWPEEVEDDEEVDEEIEESEVEDEMEEEGDELDVLDRLGLKKFIKQKDLGITVKKDMSDDEIRNAIRQALLESEMLENEPKVKETASTGKSALDEVRAKLNLKGKK